MIIGKFWYDCTNESCNFTCCAEFFFIKDLQEYTETTYFRKSVKKPLFFAHFPNYCTCSPYPTMSICVPKMKMAPQVKISNNQSNRVLILMKGYFETNVLLQIKTNSFTHSPIYSYQRMLTSFTSWLTGGKRWIFGYSDTVIKISLSSLSKNTKRLHVKSPSYNKFCKNLD